MPSARPTVSSLGGMVAAAHPLAAQAGAQILRSGGNAFDAAVATAAALNVVEPSMSGLAGMGVATCYVARERRVRVLDFVTPVPEDLPIERFRVREDLLRGPLGCGTPGNLAGWCEMLRTYGTKSLAEVFAGAIELARGGIPMPRYGADQFTEAAAELRAHRAFYGDWLATYAPAGTSFRIGQVIRQPDLTRTYEAIAAEGPGYLYVGPLGRAIVEHLRRLGGCLTLSDLERARPRWSEPIAVSYRGLRVHTPPPPSESFQFLLTLRVLEAFDLAGMGRDGANHLDTVFRAIRLAAGARIANNKPSPEKLMALLSDDHVEQLRQRVCDGAPVEGPTEQFVRPQPGPADPGHTTSFSVADRDGNVVCQTQSLGSVFGCGVVVPGTGVCLNNFLYWGEVDPDGANYMRPGSELALPIAPSISLRDGRMVLALGTPGSYGICQTQTQAMVQYIDFELSLQEAVEAPRGRLWDGRRIDLESRIPDAVVSDLRRLGHAIEVTTPLTAKVGSMQAVAVDPDTGVLTGAADPRRDGYAVPA